MTSFKKVTPPKRGEYLDIYQHYYDELAPGEDIFEQLSSGLHRLEELAGGLSEEQLRFRYAEGKWSIKEILVHLMDTERIFAYRALRAARKDETPTAGFDENIFTPASGADARSIDDIFKEYNSQRISTVQFFGNLPEEALLRRGRGLDEHGEVFDRGTVRAMLYFIAGHELHHLKIIRERYL